MANTLSGRLVTGGLIVLIGVLLLLSTTGVAATDTLFDWLPLVFVLLGVWALVRSDFRNLTGPVMVVAIAGTFLLRNLGVVSDETIGTWWPLFVVLFGLLVLFTRSRRRTRLRMTGLDAEGELTAIGIFGGSDRRLSTDRFTGAELLAVFGGVELDLRDVSVPSPPAVVETVTLFGGTEIRVPDDWVVELDVLALFGAAEDDRPRQRREDRTRTDPDLIVTGVVLFGGVEVLD
jgi:predicted membrane protein